MDRHGRPDEEMFLKKPREDGDGDSPTVEPLRIFKPQSPVPGTDKSQFRYPSPATKQPSFPLPPGASSSAAPLPFPEDEDFRPSYQSQGRTYSGSTASSARSDRYNDTTPRLETSPVDKRGPGLAERRGTAPRPLPGALSPSSPNADAGLFAKPPGPPQQRPQTGGAGAHPASNTTIPEYPKKPYYPPPQDSSANLAPARPNGQRADEADQDLLRMPKPGTMNRFASTASTSTTRGNRGSPPPPETPIVGPGEGAAPDDIAARYAASGISGTATLNGLQSSAAQSRLAQYGQHPATVPRPWTPTEQPDQQPHGPPTVYQGADPVPVASPTQPTFNNQPKAQPSGTHPALQVSVLEQDFQRMQMADPPPAYSSVTSGSGSKYPAEKQRSGSQPQPQSQPAAAAPSSSSAGPAVIQQPANAQPQGKEAIAAGLASPVPQVQGHPAFANDGHPAFANDPRPESSHSGTKTQLAVQTPSPFQGGGLSSPPPMPEGWIAHLDQNSGQYYYIHLATQATQWEFPKGPQPLNNDVAPMSPGAQSTYGNPLVSPMFGGGKSAMASPLFPPQTPGYAESIMSVAHSTAPSTVGFTGPPPSAGVDMFKVQPTNGVYFGPYLRYTNMNVEKGIWYGSIMIVSDAPQAPTIHMHLSVDLSPNPRQLVPHSIYTHQRWQFYKYEIDLPMGDGATDRWTYAVTSHLGCTRYEFVVAGKHETNWRFFAHSGNDFAASTSQAERSKLGGVGFMWKDVLQKNVECGGFHAQLGLGNQVYGDRLWKEVPLLKQWLATQGKDIRNKAQWTARHEEDVSHAYFHYYTSHFDQPFLREAFAQIPHVCQIDDHDIFDGYGSYPDYMQSSQMFKNIGRIAIDCYLLFQHHTTLEILRNVNHDMDLFTITGQGWHFVKYLGPGMVVVGADLRSERTPSRVLAGPTYQGLFPKVAMLPPSVQHCIWMLSVPVIYPRLDTVETLANTFATGKKAVNLGYNVLGKVTSNVAGIVGGKDVVAQGFSQVKKAVGKSGLMGNVVNQFGDLDISEILKDMWTHDSKDLERTYLIRTLQGISQQKGIRMTFLSGDVTCCGAGLVHDPTHPSDHKTMYQIISSPIVAAPTMGYILKVLHNNKTHYVPANGHKSSANDVTDTKEDMMEIFHTDASGTARELKKLMNRRNYVTFVAYDPEAIPGTQYSANIQNGQSGLSKLSLAVDYVVQGDGAFTTPTKYGPVIVPHLEYGR